jgi:transposase
MYKIKLSPAELEELNRRRKNSRNKEISNRLQCIYLAHTGKGNKEISDILAINKNSATNWIKTYLDKDKGLDELCREENFDRRISKIDDYIEAVKQDVRDNNITDLAGLKAWLNEKYAIELKESWLSRLCKKNSICLTRKRA